MIQLIKSGDFVRLTRSTNEYVPIGSILHVESLSQITDKSGRCEVFNVTYKKSKYIVHRNDIQKSNYIAPEKVSFT